MLDLHSDDAGSIPAGAALETHFPSAPKVRAQL